MCTRIGLSFLLILLSCVNAWDNDDLEVFDVVEEVNQNFYELMGIQQDAQQSEIKRAFKSLTLKLHPDKNPSPDADIQFRNLVSVHNILKDPGKREKYNEVLKNGLPNWRSAVYYYRHVRKMGLAEMSVILFIIITLGQYIVGWAAYIEKKYTAEQILTTKLKRNQKKANVDNDLSMILNKIPKPTIKNTLPFQIPRFIWWTVVCLPSLLRNHYKEQREEKIRREYILKKEKEEREREAQEAEQAKANKGPRKRRGFIPQERNCLLNPVDEPSSYEEEQPPQTKVPVVSGGLWTDDDLVELVRLVKKYPGGTPERWERIAEAMFRSVSEVTHMAAKLKDNFYKLPGHENETIAPVAVEPTKKVKTRKSDAAESQSNWSQTQQKALEAALAKYPKTGASDRWEKIAHCVPDKTKEECMLRCKYLADLVKKQRQKDEEERMESSDQQTNGICENGENNSVNR